jgi:alpha/beta superfamily hydrolase
VLAIDVNSPDDAWATAILLHPHPDMGGNRFNSVVEALYRALPPAGVGAVRFDFSSSDTELAAARTVEVIDETATRPLVLIGYSFGAAIATMISDNRLAGWFLVAAPLRLVSAGGSQIGSDPRPKALAVPEFDQFSPPAQTLEATEGWVNATVSLLPGTDHFLHSGLDDVVAQVLAWLRSPALSGEKAT